MVIRASAPGKLMFAGEYTVADPGGPAIAVAVDLRATVTITPAADGWTISSEALGLAGAPTGAVPVVAAALQALSARGDMPPGGHIAIESELGVGATKPGLGASAAICVAVTGALSRMAGQEIPSLPELIEIHRASQGGRGSGYDIATALHGGICLFDSAGETPTVRQIAWPDGLHASALFTGHGASTEALLDRVNCWRQEDPDDMALYLKPLVEETRELVEAFQSGEIERILTAAAQAQEELDGFDRAGEIGIYGGGQMQLLAVIEDAGAIGRTAGAGGGDSVWALSADAHGLQTATDVAVRRGFARLEVTWPAPGLTIEEDGE